MVDTGGYDGQGGPGEYVGIVTLPGLIGLGRRIVIYTLHVSDRKISPTLPNPVNVGNGEPDAKTARPSE